MTIKKTIMMILVLGTAIVVSCKKKDDPAPTAATTTAGTTTSGTTTSGTTTSGTTTSGTTTSGTTTSGTTTSGTTTSGTTTSGTTSGSTTISTSTKTSLLIGKNWKLTASTTAIGTAAPIDDYAIMEACEKDDIIVFSAASPTALSGTVTTDVKIKCDPTEMNETQPWSFNALQTEIIINGAPAKIIELTAKTLKLSISLTDPSIGSSTSILTLTAQ
ncbi:MAG: hypothetical protein EAZ07_03795 [Cytophagales bacterium]|nr:MAG: hypothetical protein EAZ07_03795 [Cytophagales bacterium]